MTIKPELFRSAIQSAGDHAAIGKLMAENGVRILPLGQRKEPLTPRGFHDARPVASPWLAHPDNLIGMATSDFWVLDMDPPLAESTLALCVLLKCSWRDLRDQCAFIVSTPRGGDHLYWPRVAGLAIRTVAGDIAKGVDTRGHDAEGRATGYIVAPGCRLVDGRRYDIIQSQGHKLTVAPRRLLWLASFSRGERAKIAASAELSARMRDAEPSAWRSIFSAHESAVRARLPSFTVADGAPMRLQALHDLDAERQRLAGLKEGRRTAIFNAALRLARYRANSILTADEIEVALIDAWHACGAVSKHGLVYPRGAIGRALHKGRNDPLPPLARRFRVDDGSSGR